MMNILIVKPGAMGDLLQMTPVFRALKGRFPDCRITLMTGSAVSAAMFRHLTSVDDLMVFNRKGEHRSLASLLALRREIKERKFNLVLNFQRSNLKAWFLITAAFPSRILIYHKARRRVVHAVQNHLETLAPLGIDASLADKSLEIVVGEEAERYADNLFDSLGFTGNSIIALNPGATHPVNRWHPGSFALLADRLVKELDVKVVIVGGKEDLALAEEISRRAACNPVILTGTTSLLELGAVLKRCRLLVSGDTGPMHMATAVGTRVVALFGAADPARTGPVGKGHQVVQARGVSCVPCRSRQCASSEYLQCMEKLAAEAVFAVVSSMLAEGDEQ